MPPRVEKERPKNELELPPPPSEGALRAWEEYEQLTGVSQEKAQIRSTEIALLLHDIGGKPDDTKERVDKKKGKKELFPSLYEVAYLIELIEKLNSDDELLKGYARQVLDSYKGDTQIDTDYVRAFAADGIEVSKFLKKNYQEHVQANLQSGVHPWSIPGEQDEIPLDDIYQLMADSNDLDVENPIGVNIEYPLIGAASAYNTLKNAKDFSEEELLKAVYDIEYFYQPFIADIRFDGYESIIKNAVGLTRMIYGQGLPGVATPKNLEDAQTLLQAAGLGDIKDVLDITIKSMKNVFPGYNVTANSVLYDVSGHGVKSGIGSLYSEVDPSDESGLRLRAKTEYSVAENLLANPNDHVSDLLGKLVIVPSYEAAAERMTRVYRSLKTFLSVQEKSSASRVTSIVLQGSTMPAVVTPILMANLKDLEDVNIDIKSTTNGYQVGKITYVYMHKLHGKDTETPIELQFQTPEDRLIATVGEATHGRKGKKYKRPSSKDIAIQMHFYNRRLNVSNPKLTDLSQQRAEQYFEPEEYALKAGKKDKTVKDIGHSSLM